MYTKKHSIIRELILSLYNFNAYNSFTKNGAVKTAFFAVLLSFIKALLVVFVFSFVSEHIPDGILSESPYNIPLLFAGNKTAGIPLLWVLYLAEALFCSFINALWGIFITFCLNVKIRLGELFKISLHAYVPVIFLGTMLIFSDLTLFYDLILKFAAAMVYIFFAIKAVSREMELERKYFLPCDIDLTDEPMPASQTCGPYSPQENPYRGQNDGFYGNVCERELQSITPVSYDFSQYNNLEDTNKAQQ